ncbi:Mitochondrial import inner membrane translocase subunit Tim13, related [Babesia divergens]|uniref:Mitochondrial import inner membrane translocase subunit n=1 Tax=Babesia divergens TaxID=32595 RepID=A0AAD9G8W7_BABDI|nr:Mitochondrial import inner membrane translocase subunit Tim13, related [Babesia divergens]
MGQDSSSNSAEINAALNMLVLSMLNEQVKKVCFNKCFGSKFGDVMNKSEQICLAKCMDRMYEAHAVLTQAASEAAKSIAKSE